MLLITQLKFSLVQKNCSPSLYSMNVPTSKFMFMQNPFTTGLLFVDQNFHYSFGSFDLTKIKT